MHQHQARSIPDQNLDPVRSFRSEHEGCAAERIETEHLLHLCRKPIVATAEVDRPHCNVNLQISTGRDHRDARTARITRDSCSPSMAVSVRSTTSPIAISSLIARFCAPPTHVPRPAARMSAGTPRTAATCLAAKTAVANRRSASASLLLARNLGHWAPGSRLSVTIRALSASERTRRPDGPSRTSSRLTDPADGPSKWTSFLLSNPIPNLRPSRRLLRIVIHIPKQGFRLSAYLQRGAKK